MELSDIKCGKCGDDAMEAANRGAYLERVSQSGEKPIVMQCAPSCEHKSGSSDDAVVHAILGD